jgi:hypothetical protein
MSMKMKETATINQPGLDSMMMERLCPKQEDF